MLSENWHKPNPPKKKAQTTLGDTVSPPTFWISAAASGSYFPLFSLHCLVRICADTKLHSKTTFQEVPRLTRQIWGWVPMNIKEVFKGSFFLVLVIEISLIFMLRFKYFLFLRWLFLSCLGLRWW